MVRIKIIEMQAMTLKGTMLVKHKRQQGLKREDMAATAMIYK